MGIQAKRIIVKKDRSFNQDKYIKNICELIMDTYGADKVSATIAIKRSGLIKSLNYCPETTSHISDEDWAEKIWVGYQKYLITK